MSRERFHFGRGVPRVDCHRFKVAHGHAPRAEDRCGAKRTVEISDENRQKFEAIFGKLTWRITARRWEAEYEDQKWGSPYSVVAADKKSVVISHLGEPGEQPELKQYFFEGEYMYVVAGHNIEFFKRIEA